jgi:leader peptidase (prepilin peptidase)/N-methyltransferase
MSFLSFAITTVVAGFLGVIAVVVARHRIDVLRATGETFAHRNVSRSFLTFLTTVCVVVVTSHVVSRNIEVSLALVGLFIAIAGLAYLSLIDIDTHLLPWGDSFTIGTSACVFLIADAFVHGRGDVVLIMMASGAAMWAVFRLIEWGSRGDLGGGDVVLASVLATVLGWFGASAVLDALVYSMVCAGIFALLAMMRAGFRMRSVFAFGPFLVTGALLAMMTSDPLWATVH